MDRSGVHLMINSKKGTLPKEDNSVWEKLKSSGLL